MLSLLSLECKRLLEVPSSILSSALMLLVSGGGSTVPWLDTVFEPFSGFVMLPFNNPILPAGGGKGGLVEVVFDHKEVLADAEGNEFTGEVTRVAEREGGESMLFED